MEEEKVQEILMMHDAGVNLAGIASELNVSPQTARRVLKDHGKETARRRLKTVDEEAVVREYLESTPVPAILKQHGISYTLLYSILAKNDVPTRKVATLVTTNARLDKAVELYIAGLPLWNISQETGIMQPTLHSELHRRGVPLRRPRML